MRKLSGYKIRLPFGRLRQAQSSRELRVELMLVGFIAVIVLVGGIAKADFTFGEPVNLGPTINSLAMDGDTCISPDGLSLYFSSNRPGGSGGNDLWLSGRATKSDAWGTPVNLGPVVNSSTWDSCPSISSDGLWLYFESERPDGTGGCDIWVTSRSDPNHDWGLPVNPGPALNSWTGDSCPSISSDGLSLYFSSRRPGGSGSRDLWMATRETVLDLWEQPVNLGPTVNSSFADYHPSISVDGLALFFFSNRPGGSGDDDVWLTTRISTNDEWSIPVNPGPTVNSSARDIHPYISAEGSTLYFSSYRPGGSGSLDLWQVSIDPVVDFNSDGNIDTDDLLIMIGNWGTDESLCDIGPFAWGDGVVDIEDLTVFIEYWEQSNQSLTGENMSQEPKGL